MKAGRAGPDLSPRLVSRSKEFHGFGASFESQAGLCVKGHPLESEYEREQGSVFLFRGGSNCIPRPLISGVLQKGKALAQRRCLNIPQNRKIKKQRRGAWHTARRCHSFWSPCGALANTRRTAGGPTSCSEESWAKKTVGALQTWQTENAWRPGRTRAGVRGMLIMQAMPGMKPATKAF